MPADVSTESSRSRSTCVLSRMGGFGLVLAGGVSTGTCVSSYCFRKGSPSLLSSW